MWYKKAVEVWSTLQTSHQLYPACAAKLADAKRKLTEIAF